MGQQALARAYSREEELEADAFAVALVRTAGGDALAGERLLERLARQTSGQGIGIAGDYFATHPPLMELLPICGPRGRGNPIGSGQVYEDHDAPQIRHIAETLPVVSKADFEPPSSSGPRG
jgi:predicted Zn-dependent protease